MAETIDDDDYPYDLECDFREPWCRDFERHGVAHQFCADHQRAWFRIRDGGCPECKDDPHCPECHCALFEEHHDWDCSYAGDGDED